MSEQFTKITKYTWAERLKNSFSGIFFGATLFFASFPILMWNEGRFIDREKAIEEGLNSVINVSSERILKENQGALVHITGIAKTDEILKDKLFGIEVNAIKLQRKVETYQWHETSTTKTKKDFAGTETQETTYTYTKNWSESWINSSNYYIKEGHENPKPQFYSKLITAKDVKIGAFELTNTFLLKISRAEPVKISQDALTKMDSSLRQNFLIINDTFYKGNPESPEIGDVRVSFIITPSTEVSAIGKQEDSSLQIYHTKYGQINLLMNGSVDAVTMFQKDHHDNTLFSWFVRLLSLLFMWIGLNFIFFPLTIIFERIPFLGNLLNSGISQFTLMISVVLSLLTIAISWLIFKPILAIMLLVIVAMISIFAIKKSKKKKTYNSSE